VLVCTDVDLFFDEARTDPSSRAGVVKRFVKRGFYFNIYEVWVIQGSVSLTRKGLVMTNLRYTVDHPESNRLANIKSDASV
jgi:hypothetical protein